MKKEKIFDDDTLSKWLVRIATILAICAMFSPFIFTRASGIVDFSNTGEIGDTIGGLTAPFIGTISIIVMFLAFYMQLKANNILKSQFERNLFENQFFEMLKIHKENSNVIINSFAEKEENMGFGEEAAYRQWRENRKKGFEYLVKKIDEEYEYAQKFNTEGEEQRKVFIKTYFSQWEDSFGHYFRHLFLLVKFVVSKDFLTYEEKRNYLRILRASLSTYEQVFLFYNWASGAGDKWENEKNKFFTDYRMIHNIPPDMGIDAFDIRFIPYFENLIKEKTYLKEKDNNNDSLFEFEDRVVKIES
ncbi:MAG: putative phage abortive infection protein [Bacteroidales bacterium]|jgi:hypothetical protein|nr:putative phage abortive infection protein [Bacteroidales bacterium]